MAKRYRVGFDIGGTFTDLALHDRETGAIHVWKQLSTPSDPSVAKLSLARATELLVEALSQLPALAKDLETKPALELLDGANAEDAVFLVLDHDDLAGVDLRPHLPDRMGNYTAEPTPESLAAPSTPLADLLVPLTLDPLTVHDDPRFLDLLATERNLPQQIADEIPNLY